MCAISEIGPAIITFAWCSWSHADCLGRPMSRCFGRLRYGVGLEATSSGRSPNKRYFSSFYARIKNSSTMPTSKRWPASGRSHQDIPRSRDSFAAKLSRVIINTTNSMLRRAAVATEKRQRTCACTTGLILLPTPYFVPLCAHLHVWRQPRQEYFIRHH
jgi:hypothetical protein